MSITGRVKRTVDSVAAVERVKGTVERPVELIRGRVESTVPLPVLVRMAHAYNRAARKVYKGARQPVFVERPIPDGATIPLADIDMSNPFLYRQGQWESHLKRLRDESPVHYQTTG